MSEEAAARELATAALLSSRLCHDLISPVGALANGLEVLAEETDAEMRGFAMDLINSSAQAASVKLQFARFAYGAGGGVGDAIDTVEAEKVARGYLETTKAELVWKAPALAAPKDAVKLLLNFVMIGLDAIPYGGMIEASLEEEPGALQIIVSAKGKKASFSDVTRALLTDAPIEDPLNPRSIQAYYAALISRARGLKINLSEGEEQIALSTRFPLDVDG
jgi:histidine phosphotransferase ChpT